jgi:gluconate 2-dehydrogenase gamma chain
MQSLYVAYLYRAADMKNKNDLTRRQFLLSASAVSGTTLARLSAPSLLAITQAACTARDDSAAFATLTEGEAADLSAIAARIIPTTDTPGVTEAGVIHFFDNAFAAEMSDKLEDARNGLEALNKSMPGGKTIADLPADEQDDRLRAIEGSAFFDLMRQMTIFGFFAMSNYGGNKDHIGWELIGFKGHNGGWQYPFGYYDAHVHGGRDDGE